MLEQLFGSRTRFKLLKHFFKNSERVYFVRELTRELGEQLNSIRRELANLESLGVIRQKEIQIPNVEPSKLNRHKYYGLNERFILLDELRDLILKSNLLLERVIKENIDKVGDVHLLVLTGNFIAQPDLKTDVLVVGNFKQDKFSAFMSEMTASFDQDIRYTLLTPQEYEFRKRVADRFLFDILENNDNIIVIDRL